MKLTLGCIIVLGYMRNHTSEINITFSFKISRYVYMGHLTYMLFNIYYSINCRTLTHTLHINIYPPSVRLSVSVII